ncbi:MAG: hypothetical protein FWG29_02900 [Treponema sp.]|nr:hypothetical protein [Treponema sp.]
MKRLFFPLLLVFLAAELFAQNLTALETRIISAGPEEMLRMVMDRNLEQDFLDIYYKFEDREFHEFFPEYMAVFSGVTEEECLFIVLKVALVAALGSGDIYSTEEALDFLDFFGEISSAENRSEMPDDLLELMESSRYWQDIIAFYRILDPEAFFRKRFPENF